MTASNELERILNGAAIKSKITVGIRSVSGSKFGVNQSSATFDPRNRKEDNKSKIVPVLN